MVLQNAEDQLFNPTVLDDVAFGPLNLGMSVDEARERSLRP
jgi:cobalt/nickel transport system ATP-binding protein